MEWLRHIPLFAEMTNEQLAVIANAFRVKRVKRKTVLFQQDEAMTVIYFIRQGDVKIYRHDVNGQERILNVLTAGDFFPHKGFFMNDTYPANAMTVNDCELLTIQVSDFERIIVEQPQLAIPVIHRMSEMIRDLQQRLEAQLMNNSYEQVVKLLLRFVATHGTMKENGDARVQLPLSNQELALMVGATRETVSRMMSRLKQEERIVVSDDGALCFNYFQLVNIL